MPAPSSTRNPSKDSAAAAIFEGPTGACISAIETIRQTTGHALPKAWQIFKESPRGAELLAASEKAYRESKSTTPKTGTKITAR